MVDLVNELHTELSSIFKKYTTRQWKNGWQHEGDIESKELTVQKITDWNNMFLVEHDVNGDASFSIKGTELKFTASYRHGGDDSVRFDITCESYGMNHSYYYITKDRWESHKLFAIDLCKKVYNSAVSQREFMEKIPNGIRGEINPDIFTEYHRKIQLNEILK